VSDTACVYLTYRQEYFADYAPLMSSLFSLNHHPTSARPLWGSTPNHWNEAALERSVQGIIAVLLSLKKKPIIRYERMSSLAKKLGAEVLVINTVPSC
jgi:Sec1 family